MTQDPALPAELVAIVERPGPARLPSDCRARPFASADGSPAIAVEAAPAALTGRPASRAPGTEGTAGPVGPDRRAVAQAALVRQTRLEGLAEVGTVLPVAGGTPVPPDLATFAAANAPTLEDAFGKLRTRSQYQIVVTWDASTAPARFAAAPELAQLCRDTPAPARAAATGALARRLGDGIAAQLAAAVFDAIRLPGDPDCLLNLVVLADRTEHDALETALERIDGIWTEGLRIRLIGPSPAVSFALGQIETLSSDRVVAAARLLGLDPASPFDPTDIARARRRAVTLAVRAGAALPAEIDRAAHILSACGRIPCAPAESGLLPVLSLARDGPPMAALPPGAEDMLSEVA